MNVLALIMIFFFVPETKERTLEELDYIFAVPVRTFGRYQLGTALPWWFKRWVLFQRNATKKPLYHLTAWPTTAPCAGRARCFERTNPVDCAQRYSARRCKIQHWIKGVPWPRWHVTVVRHLCQAKLHSFRLLDSSSTDNTILHLRKVFPCIIEVQIPSISNRYLPVSEKSPQRRSLILNTM